ncbi:rab proteins geranylgeranyltransferase component A 1 isoform X2 [Hyla sarda]|uniref:rab proteins geranylgeranyltransferase component A 1 isoform X2 n=1 Tax=Hyla sarda TaxID=327740 RepID=UPI0024C29C69|nr:rab proteins geranylgeranyltransferase component A 1 isoform X2 [Hyla sarda]
MADDLPAELDVVILGTGLPESIIAAACSRIGQRVLHLDSKNYYGANWASFTFSGLQTWMTDCQKEEIAAEEPEINKENILENEEPLLLTQQHKSIQNIEVFTYSRNEDSENIQELGALGVNPELLTTQSPEAGAGTEASIEQPNIVAESVDQTQPQSEATADREESIESDLVTNDVNETDPSPAAVNPTETQKTVSYSDIVREGRRFNIDLVSKFLYSRGLLIDLLIKSNVSRYTEFKNVTRILTYHGGKIEQVPCSRADVFSSKQLSMIEKRTLMKFLTFCANYEQHPEEYQDQEDCTFSEFLQSKRLSASLQHFVLCSIAMVSKSAKTIEGLTATQHFLRCLGRYGNTPFLFHMYGLGEIPQCFCRMSAVFGGIYCLHHSLRRLLLDTRTSECTAVIDSRGKRISCRHVVIEDSYLPKISCTQVCYRWISRAILITDSSILSSDSDQEISVLTVPPDDDHETTVHLTELCSATNTCMKHTYRGAEQEKPQVLWVLYFNMRDSSGIDRQSYTGLPSNLYVCSGPDPGFGYDGAIQQAENIFRQMFPAEEFCPPAPNPEDIIYDGEPVAQPDPEDPDQSINLKAETSPENVSDPAEEPQAE